MWSSNKFMLKNYVITSLNSHASIKLTSVTFMAVLNSMQPHMAYRLVIPGWALRRLPTLNNIDGPYLISSETLKENVLVFF